MKLIAATPSPFARKVRVALLEKGLAHEVVMDNPWLPGTPVAALNPLGKVPALVLDDGRVLHDSKVIIEYLEALGTTRPLLPADPMARVAPRLAEAVADGVCDAVVLMLQEQARPPALRSADWVARQQRKVDAGVVELARLYTAGIGFDRGFDHVEGISALGLAELATGCMLGYLELRLPAFDWRAAAPALQPLWRALQARPSFAATVPVAQPLPTLG